jgi:hypothetical protein
MKANHFIGTYFANIQFLNKREGFVKIKLFTDRYGTDLLQLTIKHVGFGLFAT